MAVVAAGLVWRRPELGLPWAVAKYGGSALWGAMVFFCVAAVMGRSRLSTVALTAAVVSVLVEASQLLHVEPLDQFRRTAIGALLLGRTFSWWDIVSYCVGIVAASLTTVLIARHARSISVSALSSPP